MEKFFKLGDFPETSIKKEFLAGATTFVTMAYVLATVPNMLNVGGMDRNAILTSMILLIILTTVAMAVVTNRPFALAPGLGSVAIVSGMIANDNIPPSIAAGIIFISGTIFVLISFLGMREAVVRAIPASLKHAVSAGIGLFIALIGAKSAGLIVAIEGRNALGFGQLNSPEVILAFIGFLILLVLKTRKIPGDMILTILITTIIGIPMGLTKIPETFYSLPTSVASRFLDIDIMGALKFAYVPFVIALFVPDFFSTFGTVIGVGAKAGYLDKEGNLPGIDKCFQVDALATVFGSLFCMPSMTTYLESAAGVEEGGKTGLTVVFTSLFFFLSLFFAPLALMIPKSATAPVIFFIGVSMLGAMRHINYDDFSESLPSFLCIAITIFANNIANGITVAIPTYVLLKLASGKGKDVPNIMYAMILVSFLYFYTIISK